MLNMEIVMVTKMRDRDQSKIYLGGKQVFACIYKEFVNKKDYSSKDLQTDDRNEDEKDTE